MTTLNDIEKRAAIYADARAKVAAIVREMNAGIDAVKHQHLPGLRRAVQRATQYHDELKNLVEGAPELFVRPKTVMMNGIRVGYQKGKGAIVFDDADAVVAAIQKLLPDQAETLIRWTGKPVKEALNGLDVATLKKLGCRVEDSSDQVVIKVTDSEVDKLVDALLKSAAEVE